VQVATGSGLSVSAEHGSAEPKGKSPVPDSFAETKVNHMRTDQ
jgi:hypothetical protein